LKEYQAFIVLVGIAGVVIGALLLAPAQSEDIFIISSGSGNDTTDCTNLGSGTQVYKDGNCNFRTLVGSSDISITNGSNTIVIDYNGTISGTDCINVGAGTHIIQNSTDNCYVRTLVSGTGISLSNNSNTVTITNSLPDNTTCTNVGTGSQVYKENECDFRTILGSADISVTQQSNTITIDYNGTSGGVTSLTSANSAITLNASNGNVLITPKWQLLVQNTTIGGSAGGITTIVNQASGTNAHITCGASDGTTGCAERTSSTSVLNGQIVNRMVIGLRKVSTPTGTLSICVLNSANSCIYTFGTQNIASLTTSCVSYTYTGTGSHTIQAGQWIGVKSPALTSTQQVQACATNPNQFDGTASFIAQFASGAWVNATTWDLGSNDANGAWKLQKVGSAYIEADFTAKKHLMVTAELRLNQSDTIILRMNNDTNTNYALRNVINGVVTSQTSEAYCDVLNDGVLTSGDRPLLTMWIDNNQSGDRKLINGVFGYGADSSSATAPSHVDFTCKWSNTSSQINNIVINGDWLSGSILTVWGYD
jgi:hypothetical protein